MGIKIIIISVIWMTFDMFFLNLGIQNIQVNFKTNRNFLFFKRLIILNHYSYVI